VIRLSEVRWKESGDFVSDGYRIVYSGGKERHRRVAMILDSEVAKRVICIKQVSDRMMMIKLQAEPVGLVLVQAYMPTTGHSEEEIETIYGQSEEILSRQKGTDYVVVMGDMNAVVGEGIDGLEVGMFGLGQRNERAERLVEFCKSNRLVVTNTWFEQGRRRRYTSKKPGDKQRYQIDYILEKQRYRNSVKSSWSYPGANINSDHNLVAMRANVKLKKIERGEHDIEIEKKWKDLKDIIVESAATQIGYANGNEVKKPWITENF
jgi:hypothetical protein